MARIYTKEQYGDQFQPRQQSRGFNPIIAPDATSKERQKAQMAAKDLETEMISMKRQHALDKGVMDAQHGIARAKQAHSAKVMQGILSLSQTALKGAQMIKEHQEEQEEIDETLDAMGFGADDLEGPSQESFDATADIDTQVRAEGQAIGDVSRELQDGSLEGDSVAHQLQQNSAYQSLQGINGNVLSARAAHSVFLEEAVNALPESMQPKTMAEAQALIRSLNGKFFQQSGLLGGDKKRIASKLGPTIIDNSGRMATALVKKNIEADRKANLATLNNQIYQGAGGTASASELWEMSSDGYAFGNVGYNGRSADSNTAAITSLTDNLAAAEDVGTLIELKNTPKIPGNPGAGTLGDSYGRIIDDAIDKARSGRVQDWNRGRSEVKMAAEMEIEAYWNNPTPEGKIELIKTLQTMGPTGRAEANRLMRAGINNDPMRELEVAERAAAGNPMSEYELQELYRNGQISKQVYDHQIKNSKGAQITKEVSKAVQGSEAQIRRGMSRNVDTSLLSDVQKTQLYTRSGIFAQDLEQRLQSEAKAQGVIDNSMELEKLKAGIMETMLTEPQYTLQEAVGGDLGDIEWGADVMQQTKYHKDITISPGRQDLRAFTPEEIISQRIIPRTELSHQDDHLLSRAQVAAAAQVTDGNYTKRVRDLAKYMGLSPKALVEGQLQRYAMPSLLNMRQSGEMQQAEPHHGGGAKTGKYESAAPRNSKGFADRGPGEFTAATGYQYIQNELGFPARGSAYLTSAINHESTWHGRREWGQVAGDGTNRNGGLISWASWANNSARLGAIERAFGRNIADISEADQLNYMRQEMQRSYGDAYRVFMNPNASSADLQWAVSRYWGFDPRYTGSRWTDAEAYIRNPPR